MKIDLAKMPRRVDAGTMQLGPPGGMRPGGGANWGRGSQQGQKKTSVQVSHLLSLLPSQVTPANRFALFNDDEEGEVAAPAQQYHGRASEPAIR